MSAIKKIIFLTVLSLLMVIVGCKDKGGGGTDIPVITTVSFVKELNVLEPQLFVHEVVKNVATDSDYFVFYDAGLDEFIALDMAQLQLQGYSAKEAASDYLAGGLNPSFYETVDPNTPRALGAYYASGTQETFYEGLITGYLY